jgi:hypothetical protein
LTRLCVVAALLLVNLDGGWLCAGTAWGRTAFDAPEFRAISDVVLPALLASLPLNHLDRLTQPRPVNGRNLKGLNFFSRAEQSLFAALQRPGFNIAGLRRADLD